MAILDRIYEPRDIRKLNKFQLEQLAKEIRSFLINVISETGGHLSSNLGVVELTLALHLCFDSPEDKIIWDVGHQSYVHKILTGRKDKFHTLRKFKGISGFPKVNENPHDIFNTGHSSTSISAALGLAKARDLKQDNHYIISVIGDGSLTGGMAFEALNNAGQLKSNFIVILNDNNMSISENVGGLSRYLDSIRTEPFYTGLKEDVEQLLRRIPKIGDNVVKTVRKSKDSIKQLLVPGMLFEELGFTYLGPVDGHNTQDLIETLQKAKRMEEPVLIHVKTIKGKGYKPAEVNPSKFHGAQPFDKETGEFKSTKKNTTYSDVFGEKMIQLSHQDKSIVAITAAMPDGTGLKSYSKIFPNRIFDVGIAEQHAVTFAAGLAVGGFKPVIAIYSSFLQRAYDQIIHDVCLPNLPVVFAIDRAGLVGNDGETHQGIFDLSFLSHIPNMTVIAPKDQKDLEEALEFALRLQKPVAIRYPKGKVFEGLKDKHEPYRYSKSEVIYKEKDIALISVGSMMDKVLSIYHQLKSEGLNVSLINARFIKPLDDDLLLELEKDHAYIFTFEENIMDGGYGQSMTHVLGDANQRNRLRIKNFGLPNHFIEQGSIEELKNYCGLSEKKLLEEIYNVLSEQ
jgi:1-deoxy-D-xylulose-5-phosphate synthase